MHGKHLFEYAILRLVPKVEREEFLNVGVVLYCAKLKFLGMRYQLDNTRIHSFCTTCDIAEVEEYLVAFERICSGGIDAGPIGKLSMPERFRWLTATRSTVVQTSKVHPGFCDDPAEMLARLFSQMVE
jgi:Protein of unknown function (DUF3037)